MIDDESLTATERMKASELLGKSEADFTDRIVSVDMSLADIAARMGISDETDALGSPVSPELTPRDTILPSKQASIDGERDSV